MRRGGSERGERGEGRERERGEEREKGNGSLSVYSYVIADVIPTP